jgi:hypothetical protein
MSLIDPLKEPNSGGWRPTRRDRGRRQAFALPDLVQETVDERPGLGLPPTPLTALPSMLERVDVAEAEAPPYSVRIAFYSENQPFNMIGPAPGARLDTRI